MKNLMSGGWFAIASATCIFAGATQHHQLIIIGSGPAGLTAAIYAGRAKLKPLVVALTPGVLVTVPSIENWPGHEKIAGVDLVQPMIDHARAVGAQFLQDEIVAIDLKRRPFVLTTSGGDKLTATALIVASGMTAKKIDCPGEKEYWGKGVCNCALCDAPLYNGQTVAVVGGGMMAMHNTLFLSKYARKIIVLNDKASLTAPKEQIKRIERLPNVEIRHSCKVMRIVGDESKVTAIYAQCANAPEQKIDVRGVFVSIGYEPATYLFKNQLELDGEGKIKIDALGHTNREAVFAAGNAATVACSQAIVCAASGCIAAVEAEKYLGRKPRKRTLLSCQKS